MVDLVVQVEFEMAGRVVERQREDETVGPPHR